MSRHHAHSGWSEEARPAQLQLQRTFYNCEHSATINPPHGRAGPLIIVHLSCRNHPGRDIFLSGGGLALLYSDICLLKH